MLRGVGRDDARHDGHARLGVPPPVEVCCDLRAAMADRRRPASRVAVVFMIATDDERHTRDGRVAH